MPKKVSIRRKEGAIVAVSLQDGSCGYGRCLRVPMIAFYNLQSSQILPVETIVSAPVAFTLFVMSNAVTSGRWQVLGWSPLTPELQKEVRFFKKDPISDRISIYFEQSCTEVRATKEECVGLERAAVWEPEHVEDRLQDFFAGRPNKWVESMKL